MKKLSSNFLNIVSVLSGIAVLAAFTLSFVYSITKMPIHNSQTFKLQSAIRDVLPPFDHFDSKPVEMLDGVEAMKVYKAYNKNNTFVGAAVEATSNNGYKGHINVLVGFDKQGVIVDYVVLDQNETPGLGSKMMNWFKTRRGNQNIVGKNPSIANLSVNKDGGEVDAITAATISSRAFLFAIRNAYFAFESNFETTCGISTIQADTTHKMLKEKIFKVNNVEKKGEKQ